MFIVKKKKKSWCISDVLLLYISRILSVSVRKSHLSEKCQQSMLPTSHVRVQRNFLLMLILTADNRALYIKF